PVKRKRVFLTEDLVSTAGSVIKDADIFLSEEATEVFPFCIFSYNTEDVINNLRRANLSLESILTVTDLLPAVKEKLLSNEYELLCKWVDNPKEWFNRHFVS
ncbi:MAG TPA: hypothetical protein VLB02_00050, partial [Candidatus Paceibacterota bacterium]|nr:hypothetical protein [Candidatus Paceibacterota bacterium]